MRLRREIIENWVKIYNYSTSMNQLDKGLFFGHQEAPLFEMSYSNLFLNIYPDKGINRYSRLTLAN